MYRFRILELSLEPWLPPMYRLLELYPWSSGRGTWISSLYLVYTSFILKPFPGRATVLPPLYLVYPGLILGALVEITGYIFCTLFTLALSWEPW